MFIMVLVQQIQHWPLIRHFETYVTCPLLKFAILKNEYHRVIIIEPSNQICVAITKRHALSACQSTMILFSATEWFGKWFIIGMIKKKVSLPLVWKIIWAIWWQISRHWLDFRQFLSWFCERPYMDIYSAPKSCWYQSTDMISWTIMGSIKYIRR